MYTITFQPRAEIFFDILSHKDQKRIVLQLEQISQFPFDGKKLSGKLVGMYLQGIHLYRIVYIIEKEIVTVTVINIEHRKDVHR